ncbi:heavy metal translocating P-type ATPase [Moorella sp. Hama-1]|nr:heavy metal translocating P-type ATPase [Moorella sp. Hama-1]
MIRDFQRRFWVSLFLTVPIILFSPMIQKMMGWHRLAYPGQDYLVFALSTVVFFYGGQPFFKGLVAELRQRQPGMMTLIALAIGVAYVYSSVVVFGLAGSTFFWELATLIDIMLLGHWLEMRSVLGASRALEEMARLMPATAHRIQPDGSTKEIPVTALQPGERVLVKPGERVPVDGRVYEGDTTVNEAALTGESRPIPKAAGDKVIGGSINGEGAVEVKVEKTGRDTYIASVIQLVEQLQQSKSRTQDLANRAAFWLTIIAIAGGVLTLALWLKAEAGFSYALERMVTVMVATCPHALGLAIPLVVAVSTSLLARNGLLVRDRTAFETARQIQAVVFDKTGTLTEGRFGVTDIVPLQEGLSANDILQMAAAVESRSEHPIARSIVEEALTRQLAIPAAEDFQALPGRGALARRQGSRLAVVGPGYLKEKAIVVDHPSLAALETQGKTVIYVLRDHRPLGAVALADVIRPESRDAVRQLKQMGIRCLMLTGDSRPVARWVAGELGVDEYFTEVLPHQKAEKIREIQQRGLTVAMVGDGINDAPALVQADVGIAIGAGTDVAVESADMVLVHNDPRDVVAALHLARATYRKMVQNLAWAVGYNVLAIPLAAGALYQIGIVLSPAVGALLMSLSTVIVAFNAQRLAVE